MTTFATWPTKGDEREQPWSVEDPGFKPRPGLPILAAGASDPQAPEFFRLLGELGYETPISRGETAHGVVGAEEMAAVRQFRREYNVLEDPTGFGGDNPVGRESAEAHIGPWTLEAILRAYDASQRPAAKKTAAKK